MALKDDLSAEVIEIFTQQWTTQVTTSVPDPEDLRLDNHAKDLEQATVLYADIDGSTSMVDAKVWSFSAEIYKSYLRCAAKIIADEGGVVTAYDGDRIMAIFTGGTKNNDAVRSALRINQAVVQIINPHLLTFYPSTNFQLKHKVGIDTSQLRAARIGVRGNNDLVWIGRAANYAAKLTAIPDTDTLWITKAVHDHLLPPNLIDVSGNNVWTPRTWTPMNNLPIFCSSHYWLG
jgi:class 3 adenylate cyclase